MRALALAAALLLAAGASPTVAAPADVPVKAGELYFEPKVLAVPAGEVTFRVTNEGAIEHNFVVQDGGGRVVAQVPIIAPGATEPVRATLSAGDYRIVCTLPGHGEAGMVATLTAR